MAYDPIKDATSGGPLSLNVSWYKELLETKHSWKLVKTDYVKPNMGIAVDVPAGHSIRITQAEGPQINDVNFFSANYKNDGIRYDLGYTFNIEGMLLPQFARAWSNLPALRPIATVIDDNIDKSKVPENTWPIWTGGHCSNEVNQSTGVTGHHSCHSNFLEAAMSRGLDESVAAFNNINIFQPMGIVTRPHPGGRGITQGIAGQPSVSVKGEFVEFYAEIDLLVLIAHCPYGDQSTGVADAVYYTNTVEVFDTGVTPQDGPDWEEWRPTWKKIMEKYKNEGEPEIRSGWFKDAL